MSDYVPESPAQAPDVFVPTTDESPTGLDALDALQSALDVQPSSVDLVVAVDEPPPLGRAWAFDFPSRSFFSGGSQGPLPTRGLQTLGGWIEKCLNTARGVHPVHPAGYGLPEGMPVIGGPVGVVPADLEERVRDALMFHPRITDVTDFQYSFDLGEEYLAVSFVAHVDGGADQLPVNNLLLAL